jgi:hypothetical protein
MERENLLISGSIKTYTVVLQSGSCWGQKESAVVEYVRPSPAGDPSRGITETGYPTGDCSVSSGVPIGGPKMRTRPNLRFLSHRPKPTARSRPQNSRGPYPPEPHSRDPIQKSATGGGGEVASAKDGCPRRRLTTGPGPSSWRRRRPRGSEGPAKRSRSCAREAAEKKARRSRSPETASSASGAPARYGSEP